MLLKTEELLDKVGLPAAEYANRMPSELSGGEQQRIGIVRAIIGEPKILLMDEALFSLGCHLSKAITRIDQGLT